MSLSDEIMNPQDTKPELPVSKKPLPVELSELSTEEDYDEGSDPYNSTGTYVIAACKFEQDGD